MRSEKFRVELANEYEFTQVFLKKMSYSNKVANGQVIHLDNASVVGNYNTIIGNCNTITGNSNNVAGDFLQIFGNRNVVKGTNSRIIGNENILHGDNNNITGNNNEIHGLNPIIRGINNTHNGQLAVQQTEQNTQNYQSGNFQISQSVSYSSSDDIPQTFEYSYSNNGNNFNNNDNNVYSFYVNSHNLNNQQPQPQPQAQAQQHHHHHINRGNNQYANIPNVNISFVTESMLENDVSEDYEKYSCKICCERMKKLALSGCKHSFCYSCVYNIQNPHTAQIICPYCKQISYSFHEIYLDD